MWKVATFATTSTNLSNQVSNFPSHHKIKKKYPNFSMKFWLNWEIKHYIANCLIVTHSKIILLTLYYQIDIMNSSIFFRFSITFLKQELLKLDSVYILR